MRCGWKPVTGYCADGKTPIPGWVVRNKPNISTSDKGASFKDNRDFGVWAKPMYDPSAIAGSEYLNDEQVILKGKDATGKDVTVTDAAYDPTNKLQKGVQGAQEYETITHPHPEDAIWSKPPLRSKNGIITDTTKPLDVNVQMRIVDVSVGVQLIHSLLTVR